MPLTPLHLAFFTTPAFAFAGAAAVSIPIIIHLLTRMRRTPIQWGAMKFLLQAFRKHRRRLQLEQWLLLLVRCLVLLVLGLALAGPLLSGCARGLGVDATGRSIYLVIDDGLSEHATTSEAGAAHADRFDRQRKTALKLIDSLGSADQVAVYLTSRPAEPLVTPPTTDRAGVRRRIEKLQPRESRSDLLAAIKDVRAAIAERGTPVDRAFVLLLSDFSLGSTPIDQPIPEQTAKLDQQARVLVTKPMATVGNLQISRLAPRRSMILTGAFAGEGPVRIPVELELKRFDKDLPAASAVVEFALMGDVASRISVSLGKEQVKFPAGETRVSIQRDLIVPEDVLENLNLAGATGLSASAAGGSASTSRGTGGTGNTGGTTIAISARLQPDALVQDNHRLAVVEMRQRLRVAIVGDSASAATTGEKDITPNRWLSLALSPSAEIGAVEVAELSAVELDDRRLAALDAAMVLRPDQLSDAGWKALKQLVDRGGVVWIFAPAGGGASRWGELIRARLGVPWDVGIDAENLGEKDAKAQAPPAAPAPTPTTISTGAGVGLAIDKPEPEALSALAADWKDLLRPVVIRKRLPLTVTGGGDQVWLATTDGKPVLASAGVGDGSVFILATALDLAWTNLPSKPVFVPLLHESLRSVQARSAEAGKLANILAGDVPTLGKTWEGVSELRRTLSPGSPADEAGRDEITMLLKRTDEGLAPVSPLVKPGLYRAEPHAAGRLFAVNIDGTAGDTRAVEVDQLEGWLAGFGKTQWLDENDPAAALAALESRTNIGLLLLWIVLTLAVAEAFLARWFSHAHAEGARPVMGAAAMLYSRFVGKGKKSE